MQSAIWPDRWDPTGVSGSILSASAVRV